MKVFGITGGVGAGKSEVLTYLGQNYDATVIQADEAGYLVMLPGGECYGEIVKLFGRQITTETGELDRKRIAEIVFRDEEKLKALNAIVHPAVKRYIKKAIAAAEKAGTEYVFVEAALLIEEKYDEILEFSELGEFIDVPIKNYSSGMKARLGFSIATVVEPEILILDEVLSVGDAKFRKKCEKKMQGMFDHGVTVLFVSHSLQQVERLCNKAILLDHGQLIAKGDIDEVSAIYQSKLND